MSSYLTQNYKNPKKFHGCISCSEIWSCANGDTCWLPQTYLCPKCYQQIEINILKEKIAVRINYE